MTFKKTDQAAYSADAPLSAAALLLAQRNVESVIGTVVPGGSVAWDIRNAPVFCGDASQGSPDYSGEAGVAFLVYPLLQGLPGERLYRVLLRVENVHPTLDMIIRTRLISLADFLDGNWGGAYYAPSLAPITLPANTDTTLVTYVAPADATTPTTTGSPYVLVVSAVSEMGGYQLLYDPKMSGDETGLLSLGTTPSAVVTYPAALWDGSDAQTDDMIPRRILFGRADTSSTYDPGAFDPDVWFENGVQPPQYQHQLRSTGSAGPTPNIQVYPGIPIGHIAEPTDAVARQEMAYGRLYGVSLTEWDTSTINLSSGGTAHGQPASASLVQSFNSKLLQQYIYSEGPLAFDTNVARFTDPTTSLPASRRQSFAALTANYTTQSEWIVGGPRTSYRSDVATTNTSRNAYEITAVCTWQMYINSGIPEAVIQLRAVIEDSGGDLVGDAYEVSARATPTITNWDGSVNTSDPLYLQGMLLGFNLSGTYIYRTDHSLRDVIPHSLSNTLTPRGLNAFVVRVRVVDTGHTLQNIGRRIRLEARFRGDPYPPNAANAGQHSLHIWAAHVGYVRSTTPSDLGA